MGAAAPIFTTSTTLFTIRPMLRGAKPGERRGGGSQAKPRR